LDHCIVWLSAGARQFVQAALNTVDVANTKPLNRLNKIKLTRMPLLFVANHHQQPIRSYDVEKESWQ